MHSVSAHRSLRISVLAAMLVALVVVTHPQPAHAADANISLGKVATASSVQSASFPASAAIDASPSTRWSSAFADPQWLQVDLGGTYSLSSISLNWEAAYAATYSLQLSSDGVTWQDLMWTAQGAPGPYLTSVFGVGRYVRVYGTKRGTAYGYSLYDLQVYGHPAQPITCGAQIAGLSGGTRATASSVQSASYPAANAFDGSTSTRWSSAFSDPQWVQANLGGDFTICRVVLNWEAAYGKSFSIQTSEDGYYFNTVYSTTTGTGGVQTINFPATSAQYVRMTGTQRATQYGYSLWDFQVWMLQGGDYPPPPP